MAILPDDRDDILAVPTNVVTGFLGVGKTTAILSLLKQKPADERWAVLVNEFGEIGVDGGLVQGQAQEDTGVFVREVPGGCMCCASGLPMQIALHQLLRRSRPDRLLIEPTGLGHPVEVLEALSTDHHREILSLGRTLTLVDARNLSDPRYVNHPTFLQQLQTADVIVANKADLYSPEDHAALDAFLTEHCASDVERQVTHHGHIELASLSGSPRRSYARRDPHQHEAPPTSAAEAPLPESGYVTASNSGEGFESMGWRFSPAYVFDRDRLGAFLNGLQVERMKAVFITEQGVFGYNMTRDALTEFELDECMESRIEIIADHVADDWEDRLIACRV